MAVIGQAGIAAACSRHVALSRRGRRAMALLMLMCFSLGVYSTFLLVAGDSKVGPAFVVTTVASAAAAGLLRSRSRHEPRVAGLCGSSPLAPHRSITGSVVLACGGNGGLARSGALRWNAMSLVLLLVTLAFYFAEKHVPAGAAAKLTAAAHEGYLQGLCWSSVAILGKPLISALRKRMASWKDEVGHAEQVGVTSLLQGVVAAAYCAYWLPSGDIAWPPPSSFWFAMAASSALNAVIRTSETRAYAVGEMSLCAAFLAFDPVMQLLVGAAVMPVVSQLFGWPCHEGRFFSARHGFAVVSVAQGMLSLTFAAAAGAASIGTKIGDGAMQLPRGAALILLNCVLYAFTYRLDAAAINVVASTPFYFACSRLLTAATCIGGSFKFSGSGNDVVGAGRGRFSVFLRPHVALCVLVVCATDMFYMLSMYRAVSLISPVFVSAVKRGGGVLVSAALGALVFGEKLEGRRVPLFTIAAGVSLLCL